jgi:hypothetical protein
VSLPARLRPPLTPHDSRPFRLYHDRDEHGNNYLSCLIHGRQTGPVSQERAEAGHAKGERCPTCVVNIANHGTRISR